MVFWLINTTGFTQITPPGEMFGFTPGTNSQLLDFTQLMTYYETLARQSANMRIDTLGQTTEGLPFPLVTISSPGNLAGLTALRKIQKQLADPRTKTPTEAKTLIAQGKLIISVNCSIHSTEIGPTQMAPNLVYRLLSDTSEVVQKILDSTIVLLLPVHNPDGLQPVVEWFEQHAGTRYEGGPLPFLYHHYSGHDINRDWYSFTQQEVRITVEKIYRKWFPQIVIDLHQMSYYYARQFIPPYIEPIDPALHPLQLKQLEIIGDTLLQRLTHSGKQGVVNRAMYDAWTPARSFTFYYGGLRLLSETASCKIAAPIFVDKLKRLPPGLGFEPGTKSANHPAPWTGGTWNFSDVIEYETAVVFEALEFLARRRTYFLEQFSKITRDALKSTSKPAGYAILAGDGPQDATVALLENLRFAGVEIHQIPQKIDWQETQLDSGTFIIQTAQPMQIFIKSMLENVPYPKIYQPNSTKLRPSYDISTHYLPDFYGVQCRPLATLPPIPLQKVTAALGQRKLPSRPPGWGYLLPYRTNAVIRFLNHLLTAGVPVDQIQDEIRREGRLFHRGTLQLPIDQNRALIEKCAQEFRIELIGLDEPVSARTRQLRLPRVGLYQSWMATKDEGWTRFVFDSYELPFTTLQNQDIRNAALSEKFDVIIFPHQTGQQIYYGHSPDRVPPRYAGGIGKPGIQNLKNFSKSGGTIIFLNSATELALKYFEIDVENPVRELSDREFYIPGAFLSLNLNPQHPLAYGYDKKIPILFYRSPAFTVQKDYAVGFYESDSLCLSGLCVGAQHLKQLAGLVEIPKNHGKLILFGFRPQFRAQAFVSFKLLFNAIYSSVAKIK